MPCTKPRPARSRREEFDKGRNGQARERTLTLTVAIASILSSGEHPHEQHHLDYRSDRGRTCDPVVPRTALRLFKCLQGSPRWFYCPAALLSER
jgi:hypothetical protein